MIRFIRRGARSTTFCLTFLSVFLFSAQIPAQRSRTPVPQIRRPTPKEESVPAVLVMRVDDDRITADIRNSPLQKVLGELAERTGIIFEVRAEDNPPVSVHLYGVSFQEAIQRIASDNNTIFFYDKNKPTRISYVRVFPRANSVEQPSIIYLGTGAVTKSNDDIETPDQALRVLTENAGLEVRKKAIEILSQTGSAEAIEALLKSVSDPEAEIRIAAIEGLAALGAHEALSGILKSLKDPHPGVRQSAITAVALLGDENNLNDLEPLRMDDDAGVASAAETAIQKLSASLGK
jgi:hypothetical protein